MPLITVDKCAQIARVIQRLMNQRKEELAANLLKAVIFDHLANIHRLDDLERMLKNDESEEVKNTIRGLVNNRSSSDSDPPPSCSDC